MDIPGYRMKAGIDIGGSSSVIARYDKVAADAVVITNDYGVPLTPTAICFSSSSEPVIGGRALERLADNDPGFVDGFKEHLAENGYAFRFDGNEFSSEDLYAEMYKRLTASVSKRTGEEIEEAVITVPAYFDDRERQAVERAAKLAGVNVSRIMDESTAAAIACGYRHCSDRTILVCDIGGSTTSATTCYVRNGVIETLGTSCNRSLGGNDWTKILLETACRKFAEEHGSEPSFDRSSERTLFSLADSYKKVLSMNDHVDFEIPCEDGVSTYRITRSEFEKASARLLDSLLEVVSRTTAFGSPVPPEKIDDVLLVGGASRMPCIRGFLQANGFRNIVMPPDRDADTAAARGAAIAAAVAPISDRLMKVETGECTQYSIGYLSETDDGRSYVNTILIPHGTPYPARRTGILHIRKNNKSDRVDIYILQGDSTDPHDCKVVDRNIISGFVNDGDGLSIDIELVCESKDRICVNADCRGRRLRTTVTSVGENLEWMDTAPSCKSLDTQITKEVVYCVDVSRSMWKHLEKIREVISENSEDIDGENTGFSLIAFADRCRTLCGPGATRKTVLDSLSMIKPKLFNGFGPGSSSDPLYAVQGLLRECRGARFAVLLTDGDWRFRDNIMESAEMCRDADINIYAVCFGRNPDRSFIKQFATIDDGEMAAAIGKLRYVTDTIPVAVRSNSHKLREVE